MVRPSEALLEPALRRKLKEQRKVESLEDIPERLVGRIGVPAELRPQAATYIARQLALECKCCLLVLHLFESLTRMCSGVRTRARV